MKELSIEEKARRYDKALERTIHFLTIIGVSPNEKPIEAVKRMSEYIFPELAESEDEKIRKNIISYLALYKDVIGEEYESWLAWLEKQGEQPKKHDVCDYCDQQGSCVSPCPMKLVEKQGEQKPWNEEDMATISRVISIVKWAAYSDHSHPILNDEGATELIERLKSLKDRVGCEADCTTTKEWSEEDENMFERALNMIEWYSGVDEDKSRPVSNWLKSLKERVQPQKTWKPSDEQMNALRYVTNFDYGGHKAILVSLYEQLKNYK